MAFTTLDIKRFTAFGDVRFDFAPGVNVLIGENGTGKSHVLKLLYVIHEATRRYWNDEEGTKGIDEYLREYLIETFLPDAKQVGRLARRARTGSKTAEVDAAFGEPSVTFTLTHKGTLKASSLTDPGEASLKNRSAAVFLPTREMLSVYPGFVAEWEERESTYDRTYYDLCKMLGRSPLRGPREGERKQLLDALESALGGAIYEKAGRFYVALSDGEIEMPLLAEGLRKIAQLAYLVINGSLRSKSVLLWDEPEASINPEKAPLLASTILGLAKQGVQIVIATHDYVLASELSRQIEQRPEGMPECAFFSLRKATDGQRQVERSGAFALLQTNPILDALADLHDREMSGAAAEESQ